MARRMTRLCPRRITLRFSAAAPADSVGKGGCRPCHHRNATAGLCPPYIFPGVFFLPNVRSRQITNRPEPATMTAPA
jgi:hypothetical protein